MSRERNDDGVGYITGARPPWAAFGRYCCDECGRAIPYEFPSRRQPPHSRGDGSGLCGGPAAHNAQLARAASDDALRRQDTSDGEARRREAAGEH